MAKKPAARCRQRGCKKPTQRLPGPGRQPSYCADHRPASRSVDGEAEVARRASRHRATEKLREQEDLVTPALERLAIAAVLPLAGVDADLACALAGVRARGARAVELVEQARVTHRDLINGEPAALDQLVRAGIVRLASVAAVQPEAIAPGQRPQAAFVLARVRESMGLTQAPRFASIRLEVVGPDGETLSIGPTNGGPTEPQETPAT